MSHGLVRVTITDLKPYREVNVPEDAVVDGMKVLDKPTHRDDGSPIPTKYTPESLSGSKNGQKADTEKEKS